MEQEICYWAFCFVPLAEFGTKIFGFSEYIAASALLVVVFTTIDIKYQFRIAVAPVPLHLLTFVMVGVIGVMALLPELWAAQHWWVPRVSGLNQSIWQAFSGALFLSLLLTWMYYAFLRPPVFGRRNAERYAQALYKVIMKGADSEMAAVADELGRSVRPLILFAQTARPKMAERARQIKEGVEPIELPVVEGFANDILYLIGNKKFCKNIVSAAPRTAVLFFTELAEARAYDLPVGQFAENITCEAIANKNSILYEESDEFASTLIGHLKPFSAAVYGNAEMVEGLKHASTLDVDHRQVYEWDARQWQAYGAAVITFMKALLKAGMPGQSYVLKGAFKQIHFAVRDTYKLEGSDGSAWNSDIYQRLVYSVDFANQAIDVLDKQSVPPAPRSNRPHAKRRAFDWDIYDVIAELWFEIVMAASSVSHTSDACWSIHHNSVWAELLDIHEKSPARKIVAARFRRLMYDEFARMKKWPNYQGAKLLGFTLSVTGLQDDRRGSYGRAGYALGRLARAWATKEFLALKADLPDVAEACLIGTISLDPDGHRLVKTYAKGLRAEAPRVYLALEGVASNHASGSVRRLRASLLRRRG